MLVIREAQFEALMREYDKAADNTLVSYLRRRFPDTLRDRPASEVHRIVQYARSLGKRYGIEREDNIATILDLIGMYGLHFDTDQWAREILVDEALHGPDKVALLRHVVAQSGTIL
jgi:hypothetical protein